MSPDEQQDPPGREEARTTAEEVIAEVVVKVVCVAGALALWLFALGMFCATASYRDGFRLTLHGLSCRCRARR